ncbi:MAG: hypothetical protein CVT98_04715 [Bacteroidetes bacterium HGW-Bacteroidetes-15]|nr:MAG: hypothetical protein CVT98_04715 [Bacteroidetes bacterium HGW-Bacteroidetes-15]
MKYTKQALKLVIIILIIFSYQPLYSQQLKQYFVDSVILERNTKHVYHLSSQSFYGRSTLTGDDILASNYIDSLFQSFNLSPFQSIPKASNFQPFGIIKTTPLKRFASIQGISYQYGLDFLSLGINPIPEKEYEIVFAGLGNYEDIEKLDLEGKAMLVLTNNLRIGGMRICEIASGKGCSLIMLVNPSNPNQFESISQQLYEQHNSTLFRIEQAKPKSPSRFFSKLNTPVPQIVISDNFARALLGDKPSIIYQGLLKGESPKVIPSEIKVKFDFNYSIDTLHTHNVVGWIPSSSGSQQSVLVCAHFDHLAPEGQKWYPGADDNASSIAVLIELARLYSAMAKDGYQFKRNIVFAAFTAEEIGLLGSQHHSINPIFPLDSTTVVINMDMVGRLGNQKLKGKQLFVSGDHKLDDFTSILKSIKTTSGIKVDSKSLENISMFSLSDHFHFMEKGVPAFLLTTGLHTDYHTPYDTPEKLSYESMVKITEFLFETIKHFANEPNPWDLN